MDHIVMLLAQTQEAAEKGLSLLERIQAGGVPLISLVIAAVAGTFGVWQLRRNNEIEKDWRETQKKDGDENLKQQKELMREMLQRDRDALEAQNACAVALAGVTDTMKDIAAGDTAMMVLLRSVEALQRAVEARTASMETRVNSTETRTADIERKQRDLFDEITRSTRRPST